MLKALVIANWGRVPVNLLTRGIQSERHVQCVLIEPVLLNHYFWVLHVCAVILSPMYSLYYLWIVWSLQMCEIGGLIA